ncbi:MAG: hypothetical protein IJ203_08070 [Atopobiaceae bacterium]|nr:hypothetical protein [Atopobiaceae bacterium]
MDGRRDALRYAILDPTGNVTALVRDPVEIACQPVVARQVMDRHPEVEQVGFVSGAASDPLAQAELRMAGGEFCGNATMSAAALHAIQAGVAPAPGEAPVTVWMRASGAAEPVEVRLSAAADGYEADVRMPEALGVRLTAFSHEGLKGQLPLVLMEGISHVVTETVSPFYELLGDRPRAERAVRTWCHELGADGLGLMFLEGDAPVCQLTPLVYVPGGDTVFWENSCASGSAATGRYLAERTGEPVSLDLQEPGGTLHVSCDVAAGQTWLHGAVRLVGKHLL